MKTLRALLVDDERYARKEMITLLKKHPEIEVVDEASSITDATAKIDRLKPDLVFLDIQLKGETGFELFEKTAADFTTVFVTAYDNFAIRAFEVNAFDYLLKPVNPDRLAATVNRLLKGEKLIAEPAKSGLKYDDCIYIPLKDSRKFIRLNTIAVITADNEYSHIINTEGRSFIIYRSLKKWEELLPSGHFVRIHRSTIININYIDEIKKQNNNTYQVFIKTPSLSFEMSRRFAHKIKEVYSELIL